jgi:hypothetical protein
MFSNQRSLPVKKPVKLESIASTLAFKENLSLNANNLGIVD